MFEYAHDATLAIAVMVVDGESTEDEFARYMRAIDELDAIAAGRNDAAVITVMGPSAKVGKPTWRREMARRTDMLRSRPLSAIVTSSRFIRGAVTALNWLRDKPFEDQVLVATWDEAVRWVEARRGPRRAAFERLRAIATASARGRAVG